MKKKSNRVATSFVVGLIFALGLGVSGMTQPQKVIGFLNVFAWDPSLVFVMAFKRPIPQPDDVCPEIFVALYKLPSVWLFLTNSLSVF